MFLSLLLLLFLVLLALLLLRFFFSNASWVRTQFAVNVGVRNAVNVGW